MARTVTPSQTIGPFFHDALIWTGGAIVAGPDVAGKRVVVEGRLLDGQGTPVTDALVELWQANAAGRYDHPEDTQDKPLTPGFKGFGRAPTGEDGSFRFVTMKPGRVPGRGNALQAPHLNLTIFARGLLRHLQTRLYFGDEAAANAEDPVLGSLPAERRATLVAAPDGTAAEGKRYRLDIHLQGDAETVFFAV
jgi:protocatechuate 3,4-dioxygenase alpha subunit